MGGPRKCLAAVALGTVVFAGCVPVRAQDLTVSMTEGAWSIEPAVLEDVTRLDFTFSNLGSDGHQPIVVNVPMSVRGLEVALEGNGTAPFVAGLLSPDPPMPDAEVVYPNPEGGGGGLGHFHPGGSDQPDLPAHALVDAREEGEVIAYLFADIVAAGGEGRGSATSGNVTWGNRGSSTTFVVLCIDPEHADRHEFAVFSILPNTSG